MAMKGEKMKDAGDGDGEGVGEIYTPSNSDLQELARRQGELDRGSRLLEGEEILPKKDMRATEVIDLRDIQMPPTMPMMMLMTKGMGMWGKGIVKKMWKKIKEKAMGEEEENMWVRMLEEGDMEMLVRENQMRKETEETLMREKETLMREKETLVSENQIMRERRKETEEKFVKKMEALVRENDMMRKRIREMEEMLAKEKILVKEKEQEPLQVWEMVMEKCPCLLGRGPEGSPVLYFFNLLDERNSNIGEDKKDEDGRRRRRPGMQVITPAESTRPPKYYDMSVVVGSVLYVLGGGALEQPENEQVDPENEQEQEDPENEQEWSFYNEVFLCDTNHPQKRWIKGPDMLNHRCNGKAVAVESKIYVFGGNNRMVEDRPWAEFLDPYKNKWEPLPAPPADSLIHTRDLLYNPVVYGGPGKGKIFLSCCYYIYDVNDQTWEEFCPPKSLRPFSHNVTSDGNILYWSTFGHLYSFNMKTQDIGCGLVEGYRLSKYREELPYPEPTLLHLDGDYFCFITLKDLPEDCTEVCCTKFQVSHQGGLKASVVDWDTYTIDCPLDIDCSYAFVLDGKLGAEISEDPPSFRKLME